MHIDFIADGKNRDLDEMEKWLSTRVLPMKVKEKEKERVVFVPSQLRSQRKYSFVFPKENLDAVLNALNLSDCHISRVDGKGTQILKYPLNIIRKILRLKKLPKPKTKDKLALAGGLLDNIRMVGLGVRDDIDVVEDNGAIHEGL